MSPSSTALNISAVKQSSAIFDDTPTIPQSSAAPNTSAIQQSVIHDDTPSGLRPF